MARRGGCTAVLLAAILTACQGMGAGGQGGGPGPGPDPAPCASVALAGWPAGGALASASSVVVEAGGARVVLQRPATDAALTGLAAGTHLLAARAYAGAGGSGELLAAGHASLVLPASGGAIQRLALGGAVEGVEILEAADDLTVALGSTATLHAEVQSPGGALVLLPADKVSWSSDDLAVAEVVDGVVSTAATGAALIEARVVTGTGGEGPPRGPRAVTAVFVRDPAAQPAPLTARLTVSAPAIELDDSVRLTASAMRGELVPSGLRFRWDWEGDGSWDTPFTASPAAWHRYDAVGPAAPRVQVADGAGASAIAAGAVAVQDPGAVRIAVTPASSAAWVLDPVHLDATVTGTTSVAVDWHILDEGGGMCEATTATTCSYRAPARGGTYRVAAVSRADGSRAVATIAVANNTPAAFISIVDAAGSATEWAMAGDRVVLDGRGSMDPDGAGLDEYRWSYDDGQVPRPIAPLPAPAGPAMAAVSFASDVQVTIRLEVVDTGGLSGAATHPLSIATCNGIGSGLWEQEEVNGDRTQWLISFVATGEPRYDVKKCFKRAGDSAWTPLYDSTQNPDGCIEGATGPAGAFGQEYGACTGPARANAGLAWCVATDGHLWTRSLPSTTWVRTRARSLIGTFCQ